MTPANPNSASSPKRKLPLGIQNFREIREAGCYYVDKTEHVRCLVEGGKYYFLSRPRRFGKSLLVDTLKELFEGNEPLFRGLHIHSRWDWSVRHPVLRLDFSGGFKTAAELHTNLMDQFAEIEERARLAGESDSASVRFRRLIRALRRKTGQRVVVLVDEYDKPILDALQRTSADANASRASARANRDYLHGVYSVIKACDADIEFTLVTGVSRFTKVSIFSALNNLTDITLDPDFGTICGYTERDLAETFAPELSGLDRQTVRDWYNGYSWLGKERVYNPYDVLLLFRQRRFGAHWFETGTPTFLINVLVERGISGLHLDGLKTTDDLLAAFDIDDISTEALLFQGGYLTIADAREENDELVYRLSYPNREVRQSLNRSLLRALVPERTRRSAPVGGVRDQLAANDFSGLEASLRAFFASIPFEWHTRNEIANYEGYYASVCYSHFAGAGLNVVVEESSSRGRLDMAVIVGRDAYLFEFKTVEDAADGSAMAQLRERGYAEKYRASSDSIHLIGVEFSRKTRNVAAFEVAKV